MKVKLLKTHRHAGTLYLRDEILDVEQFTAHWLVEHGVAEHVKTDTKKSEKSTVTEQNDDPSA